MTTSGETSPEQRACGMAIPLPRSVEISSSRAKTKSASRAASIAGGSAVDRDGGNEFVDRLIAAGRLHLGDDAASCDGVG